MVETKLEEATVRRAAEDGETVELADGTRLLVREVRPDDKHFFLEGWEHLSEESRYFRFFGPKKKLSDDDLRYFTELDGVQHFAVGAAVIGDEGRLEPAGVARWVRLDDDPRVAEAAVTVVDELQGRGVGHVLVERLVQAAAAQGIERLRFEVLPENRRMRELVRHLAPGVTSHACEGVVVYEVPLAASARPSQPL